MRGASALDRRFVDCLRATRRRFVRCGRRRTVRDPIDRPDYRLEGGRCFHRLWFCCHGVRWLCRVPHVRRGFGRSRERIVERLGERGRIGIGHDRRPHLGLRRPFVDDIGQHRQVGQRVERDGIGHRLRTQRDRVGRGLRLRQDNRRCERSRALVRRARPSTSAVRCPCPCRVCDCAASVRPPARAVGERWASVSPPAIEGDVSHATTSRAAATRSRARDRSETGRDRPRRCARRQRPVRRGVRSG